MLQATDGRPGLAEIRYLTPEERRAQGKALREAVPREDHGEWKPPKDRRDPVELLSESNEGRMPDLIPIRFGRMMQSPFAFYRGSAALMAADLASTPKSGLMVQACGDAHLMNFGGFATPERNIIFDINDLDETLPAPGNGTSSGWPRAWSSPGVISGCPRATRRGRPSPQCAATASTWPIMHPCGRWTSGTTRSTSNGCSRQVAREEDRGRIGQRVEKARAKARPEHISRSSPSSTGRSRGSWTIRR